MKRSHEEVCNAFARAEPDCGPVVDLSATESVLRQQAATARDIAALYWPRGFATNSGFDYETVVYDSLEANALATYSEGVHWIAVSTGLIYTLSELAVRVAAVFPVPGDVEPAVSLEGAEGAGFRFDTPDFNYSVEEAHRFFRQTEQFGPVRRRLAHTLWLDAQTLVWRHEFFHASLGHTRCAKNALGLRALWEYPASDVDALPPHVCKAIRALEFHADWAAFGSTLKLTRSGLDPAGNELQQGFGVRWRASSLMAATLLLPAFLRVAEVRSARTAGTHPSASARLSIFLSRIEELPDPSSRDEWRQGAGLALQAFQALAAKHADFAEFAAMLGDQALLKASSEREACMDDFDTLQDALIPLAVLPLGHPHQGSIDMLPAREGEASQGG